MKRLLTDSALSKQSGSFSQEKGQEIVVFPDEMDRNSHLDPKRLNANNQVGTYYRTTSVLINAKRSARLVLR